MKRLELFSYLAGLFARAVVIMAALRLWAWLNRRLLSLRINRSVRKLLVRARARCGRSMSEVAVGLGIPEKRLSEIEARPGRVPLRELTKVIEYYGPEAVVEVSGLFTELSLSGYRCRKRIGFTLSVFG